MAKTHEVRNGAAQTLVLAGSLLLSGLAFTTDAVATSAALPSQPRKLISSTASLPCISEMDKALEALTALHSSLDQWYELLLNDQVHDRALHDHPFDMVAKMLGRGLQELKPLRGTGELGERGDHFIAAYAEARRKAERNAHLIRQMTVMPAVFQSSIDRAGLQALAEIAAAHH